MTTTDETRTPDEIADGLLHATLPQAAWTHAAHVIAAHRLVERLGHAGALDAFRASVPRLNASHGVANTDTDGYHETVTVGFVAAVADCVARGLDADATVAALPADVLLGWWTRDRLWSVEARHGFIPPDLAEPPFALLP